MISFLCPIPEPKGEDCVFAAVLRWINQDSTDRQVHFSALLDHVRMSQLSELPGTQLMLLQENAGKCISSKKLQAYLCTVISALTKP